MSKKIFNYSRAQMEPATQQTCPRCRGYGRLFSDEGENCHLCRGHGRLWKAVSGWTLPLWGRASESKLY